MDKLTSGQVDERTSGRMDK